MSNMILFFCFLSGNTGSLNPETLDTAGRFFLVVYNTSSTVSSSYATFVVLAISFAIAAVFGALYYGIATGSTTGKKKPQIARQNGETDFFKASCIF